MHVSPRFAVTISFTLLLAAGVASSAEFGPEAKAQATEVEAQPVGHPEEETLDVTAFQTMRMLENSERLWRFREQIERVAVLDWNLLDAGGEVVDAVRLSPNCLKVSAKKTGAVFVKLTTSAGQEHFLPVRVVDALSDKDRRRFIIQPVTTELQRLGTQSSTRWGYDRSTAKLRVFVNGAALARDDGTLDTAAVFSCVRRLGDVLGTWANRGQGSVCFEVLWNGSPGETSYLHYYDDILSLALEGLAQRAGFLPSHARIKFHGKPWDWDSIVADIAKNAEKNIKADESGVGDELVKVYPVRTAISRHDWPGVDCVIHVRLPAHKMTAEMAEKIRSLMPGYVDELDLEKKVRVYLMWSLSQWPQASEAQMYRTKQLASKPEFLHGVLGFEDHIGGPYHILDRGP